MEGPAEAQNYLEQGKTLFWQGQLRPAAAAFAQALQLDPNLVAGHLWLAQANLALGSYGLVHMACQRVRDLQPAGTEAALASALLFVLDRRYDRALDAVDQVIATDPTQAYAHALRGYCLGQLGRTYEASLAEARASRQGGDIDFRTLFPQNAPTPQQPDAKAAPAEPRRVTPPRPTWQPPSQLRRRITRLRFATRDYHLATTALIILNVAIFLLSYLIPDITIQSIGIGFLILHGEYWRVVTAIFISFRWWNLAVNMISLYFIGRWVEELYGPGRLLLLYLGSGILGGLLALLVAEDVAVMTTGNAVMGIFGALGAFLWQKRYAVGPMLSNWIFWLLLNLFFIFGFGRILLPAEIGGLASGLLLGIALMPDLWTAVRIRLKRGQRTQAISYALKPILLVLVIDVLLMVLAALLMHGPF